MSFPPLFCCFDDNLCWFWVLTTFVLWFRLGLFGFTLVLIGFFFDWLVLMVGVWVGGCLVVVCFVVALI